ncbi:MAG TPA: helix-hairpin-helix domain-containing protein [Chthoniobacterales bacterium]
MSGLLALGSTARATELWQTFRNCHYLPNSANDGDSFHVRANGKEYIFRLYFVDAPETDRSVPERVREQATYFHTSISKTLEIGAEAERFTRHELARPFTVRTCFQNARGRSRLPRYFAFVESDHTDLAEKLVANGLARVYGAASRAPQMNRPEVEWRRLEQLERQARTDRIGGWGIANSRLSRRVTIQPATDADYFQSFFHPSATPPALSPSSTSDSGAKLNINTATSEELLAIHGIGPVLAERIIAARPFTNADDLQRVKGIKGKKYAELRPNFE